MKSSRIMKIFEQYVRPMYGCVFHSFQPEEETLNYLISHNYYISFASRITYDNTKRSIEVAKKVPNHLFLIDILRFGISMILFQFCN